MFVRVIPNNMFFVSSRESSSWFNILFKMSFIVVMAQYFFMFVVFTLFFFQPLLLVLFLTLALCSCGLRSRQSVWG